MAESSLDSLQTTHTVQLAWRAYELRPPGTPPISAQYLARIEAGWPRVQQTAQERFGLTMQAPRRIGESGATRLAHMGAKYAIEHGHGPAYHQAVFRAYWQQDRDISQAAVLTEIATGLGLDPAGFSAALQSPAYTEAVEADEYWAYQQQLQGVPAFIFAERYLVSGAQPAAVLRQVADQCLQEGLGLE